ncbi:MAG TPA: hypothetical protein VG147_10395 [Solirubrobacteraceae bacterium]|nr:hypothetical protein [Solirubrobacteraceae bacterium]
MEEEDLAFAADLLDWDLVWPVDVAPGFVAEDCRGVFLDIPGEVSGCPIAGLGGSEAIAVVGVGVADRAGFAFFALFDGELY